MPARLVYPDANGVMQSIELPPQGVVLGRAPDCTINSHDPLVSGHHCRIAVIDGQWCVEDLHSTNHTFVNDTQVQRQALRDKDLIRCGTSLRVQFLVEAPQPAAPVVPVPEAPGTQRLQVVPDLAVVQKELLDAQQEIDKLRVQLQEALGKGQKLSEDRRTAMEEKDRYWRELAGMQDRLSAEAQVSERLRRDLKQMQDQRDQADQKVRDLQAQADGRDAQLRAAEVKLRDLKQAHDKLLRDGEHAESGLAELQVAYNRLRNENEGLQETLTQHQKTIGDMRQGMMEQDARLKEHKRARDEAQQALARLTAERDALKEGLAQRDRQLEEHRQQLRDLQLENQRMSTLLAIR